MSCINYNDLVVISEKQNNISGSIYSLELILFNLHGEIRYEGSLWQLDLKGKLLGRVCAVQDNTVDARVCIARNDVRIDVKLLIDYRSIILGLPQRDCCERDDWKSCQKQREKLGFGHVDVIQRIRGCGL